jgi:cytidylate kinase
LDAIIISGKPAVGKTTVARLIAEKLGLRVVGGGDVLKEMAFEKGIDTTGEDWWDTPEGIRFLEERKKSSAYDKEVDERLLKKAKNGDIVITSYTLPWLSQWGTKYWLEGSVESRARRMAKRDGVQIKECRRIVALRDVENYKIYKQIYNIEFGKDLKPFTLVVNTDKKDASRVASMILRRVIRGK